MWGEPEVAEASVKLKQPKSCHVFSQGSCLWISGPWQWCAYTGSRGGSVCVDSDLCLHTGFLVTAAAVLEVHARLWGPS